MSIDVAHTDTSPNFLDVLDDDGSINEEKAIAFLTHQSITHPLTNSDTFPSFLDVMNEDGSINEEKAMVYLLHQNNYFLHQRTTVPPTDSEATGPKNTRSEVKRKCVYGPSKWQESLWYEDYVLSDKCKDRTSRAGKLFRRRFRMPWETYKTLVKEMRDDDWFAGKVGGQTALGLPGIPLELLVLGSLRYLGRGWTFDDVAEATGVSEETHRKFFRLFCKAGR